MKAKIEVNMDNAAFQEYDGAAGEELARILEKYAKVVRDGFTDIPLMDLNGNRVGQLVIED